jgi:hypothetical protein
MDGILKKEKIFERVHRQKINKKLRPMDPIKINK